MYRELAFKELRETWWMGGVALLTLAVVVLLEMGLDVDESQFRIFWRQDEILFFRHPQPFLAGDLMQYVMLTGYGLAIALGFWQTLGESVRKTWACLYLRPLRRRTFIVIKLATGLGLLLLSTGVPILFFAFWAATPGTHAKPFEWWMTSLTWRLWFSATVFYLTAFLCGIREARWWFSRLWPAVPVMFFLLFIYEVPGMPLTGFTGILVMDGILLAAIFHSVRIRDFA
ncbi:MAG: hypothetical protein IH899_03305 [Planctomycetes bacterium]|nr:hypothetical protein [Planctomycetota bacterium]